MGKPKEVDTHTKATGGWAGGFAAWLAGRLGHRSQPRPSLQLIDRITLAPRQCLALVEVDGQRVLVATSSEGASAFYALPNHSASLARVRAVRSAARLSW